MAPNLTDHEQKLIGHVWQSFKNPPDVDLDKLAQLGGYKTRASANTAYHKLRTKLSGINKAEGEPKDEDDAEADSDADAEDAPVASSATKKGRGKKPTAVKTEEPETDEDDESETVAVKPKSKGKATRAVVAKAGTAKPVPKRRSTRTSMKASKPLVKEEFSEDSEEEAPKRVTLKRGTIKYADTKIEDVAAVLGAAEDPSVASEEVTATANTLKRAATEPGSDFDELAEPKRIKTDADVEPTETVVESVETTTTVVSTDPPVETYVVADPDAADTTTDITMVTDDGSDGVDVPSDVASAATSVDARDI